MSGGKAKPLTGYTAHNRVKLLKGGSAYFKLLEELIDKAIHSIHLQVYIYEADETGSRITEALLRARRRNVEIYLLIDGYASSSLPTHVIEQLNTSGIHFRWFETIFKGKGLYVGRRMHHKILVVDGIYSLVGGLNISDRYNDLPDQPAWLDWAVYTEGEASAELFARCVVMWTKSKHKKETFPIPITWSAVLTPKEECLVRIRTNDWVRNKNQVTRSYLEMFDRAVNDLIIMSSYFLPGRIFRKNMAKAAKRGVRVRVILAGDSDIKLAKAAELFLYSWLFHKGIEVYEFRKTVLHGKIAVIDGQMVTVGSYNINNMSAYASIELNLDVNNRPFGQEVQTKLEEVIEKDCIKILPALYLKKLTIYSRTKQWVAYELVRFIFFLFTFYFKQDGSGRRPMRD